MENNFLVNLYREAQELAFEELEQVLLQQNDIEGLEKLQKLKSEALK